MHTVKVDYPASWDHANLYPLADLHIGDPHSLSGLIAERMEQIKNDPNGLVILNGDLLNTALRHSVSDVYGEKLTPMGQIERLVDILTPIKNKIIGVTTGNHEYRVYKEDGLDIMRLVCRELGREEKPTAYQQLAVARNHRFPSTLLEMCFISNVEEYQWSITDGNYEKSARAVVNGILEYYRNQEKYLDY